MVKKINKTEDEWKEKLTPEQYRVLREKATEPAFSGKYHDLKESGIYTCAGCGAKLFSSDTKFDSGTGWPSFDKALPGSVEYKEDKSHGMTRTEVICGNCRGHLGHVFDDLSRHSEAEADGPLRQDGKPVCRRYCINSAAIDLNKETEEK